MRVLVTGGTGTLGSTFAKAAAEAGYTVRIMSRRPRPQDVPTGLEWASADLETGEGIDEAVSQVDAILHAATRPGLQSRNVDVDGTRRLVEAARAAGVAHVIYPSIVGIDEIPYRYYRHKLEAERIIAESGIPHTILRATQFHTLVDQVLAAASRIPFVIPLPTDFCMQSVAASEVALRLRQALADGAGGRLPDFGGPEVDSVGEMARAWMDVTKKHRCLVRLPLPGQTARAFREGKNTVPGQAQGELRWRTWLEQRR